MIQEDEEFDNLICLNNFDLFLLVVKVIRVRWQHIFNLLKLIIATLFLILQSTEKVVNILVFHPPPCYPVILIYGYCDLTYFTEYYYIIPVTSHKHSLF